MKILTTLVAAGMLLAGAAFAADATMPAPAAAAAAPAAEAPMAHSGKSCKREAFKQHLQGDARKEFIKNCRAGK